MALLLQVGDQALDRLLVRLVDQRRLAEAALLLAGLVDQDVAEIAAPLLHLPLGGDLEALGGPASRLQLRDRKSTRLNSSHLGISNAVYCYAPQLHTFPTRRSSDLR